jgi:hypothetical protein
MCLGDRVGPGTKVTLWSHGRIVEATLQSKPKGSTHWSTRTMAEAQKVSKNTIHRIWQEHQLKPHLTKSFKLSRIGVRTTYLLLINGIN